MSNRVEELESKVAQLEATVDGLTEELVETRERLRSLESEHEIETGRAPDRRAPEPEESETETAEPSDDVEADNSPEEKGETNEGSESEDGDIIVA